MTNIRYVFATNLKKFRQARGWSQAFLAEKADISTNYIGNLENTIKFPSSETIDKLALVLEIDPTDLFSKEIDPEIAMKTYQKAALVITGQYMTGMISNRLKEIDEELQKILEKPKGNEER
jgi:transcriptional regulator with XRE-family HTH domain